MILVNKSIINLEASDRIVWKWDKKGLYSVRANVALIEGNVGRTSPWKIIWNNLVPPKFLPWNNSGRGVFRWLVGVHRVAERKRTWITSYCIVIQFGACGGGIISIPGLSWAYPRSAKELLEG